MSDFNLAIPIVLLHEGHLVNDPADPGGITNYGISFRYLRSLTMQHPSLIALYDEDHSGQITSQDIRDMNQQEAMQIYKTQWWDKNNYGLINDQALATKIFDLAINMGNITANKLLQHACNIISNSQVLQIDGVIGPQTINIINSLNSVALLAELRNLAKSHYEMLVTEHPVLSKFLRGWLNRLAGP